MVKTPRLHRGNSSSILLRTIFNKMTSRSCDACEDSIGTCRSCNGEGKSDNKRCEDCGGECTCKDGACTGEKRRL